MLAVTAATGHLGQLVIDALLAKVPATKVVAVVREPSKAKGIAARGVQVRQADYAQPATLGPALAGVERLLLISASEVGQRAPQHANVIAAARRAGVGSIAYTSILHADRSHLSLAVEHRLTEEALRASGIPHVLLRNGWYLENYTEHLAPALQHGAIAGSARQGRIAAAARADYAAAAVAVLTGAPGKAVYELAGDRAFTMGDLAAEVSRQSGKAVAYRDLPMEQYRGLLLGVGVPPAMADALVDADVHAAEGELDDGGGELRALIGRPTTPLAEAVRTGLAGL